jgi:hypothetical protein
LAAKNAAEPSVPGRRQKARLLREQPLAHFTGCAVRRACGAFADRGFDSGRELPVVQLTFDSVDCHPRELERDFSPAFGVISSSRR